jgi:hypothetical protein
VVSWDSRFARPIALPGGIELGTLREALQHLVETVPKTERDMPAVLVAAHFLTEAAENGGPIEFARIGTLRALNRHTERVFNSDRKETHWGRRKLKRDQ